MNSAAPRALPMWPRAASSLALVALAAVLFATAMAWGIGYDEEQYVAAPYFARHLGLYRDFVSIQPPLYTWLLAAIFDVVQGWYLLTARIVTWIFASASCVVMFSLLRSFGAGRAMALALVVAFVASPFAQIPLAMTRSDIMPLFLTLAGLRLFFDEAGRVSDEPWRIGLSGALATLAFSTKYSYVFVAPALFLTLAYGSFTARSLVAERSVLLAFVAGAGLGFLPLGYELARNGERLVFLTLQFHLTAVHEWYAAEGIANMLTLRFKAYRFATLFLRDGNASMLIVLAIASGTLLVARRKSAFRWLLTPPALGLLVLLASGLTVAIRVGPYAYYYAPVAAIMVLLAGRAYGEVRSMLRGSLRMVLPIACLVPAMSALSVNATMVRTATHVEDWTGVQAHRSAERIARMLRDHGIVGHVATLFPSVVLDDNRVREEFSAGPFFFRSADIYADVRVMELHAVGPRTMDRVFSAAPPAAIVAGFGGSPVRWKQTMDRALIEYARRHDYRLIATDWAVTGYVDGEVWLRRRTQ